MLATANLQVHSCRPRICQVQGVARFTIAPTRPAARSVVSFRSRKSYSSPLRRIITAEVATTYSLSQTTDAELQEQYMAGRRALLAMVIRHGGATVPTTLIRVSLWQVH